MEIVRKKLYPGQLYDPALTYDSISDDVLYDDLAAPGLDPRHSGSVPLPASGTLVCDSAATMVALLRLMTEQMIDNINAGATATQITSAFLALLVVLGWISLFIAIIVALVAAALTAGGAALEAAFVQSTWDDLLCILFCYIDADGQLDAAALALVRQQVDADLPALAAIILNYYFDTLGEAGLNNASVVLGALETGDCVDCECTWCQVWTEAEIYADESWTLTESIVGEYTVTEAFATFSAHIIGAEFDFEYRPNGGAIYVDGGGSIYDQDYPTNPIASNAPAAPPGGTVDYDDELGTNVTEMHMYTNSKFTGGANYPLITRIMLAGTGSRPGFSNGSAC